MITEVSGDILFSKARAIAQSIAPLDHCDSGLALSLREKFPEMVKEFRHYCHTHHVEEGDIWAWKVDDEYEIINLLTQKATESRHGGGHPGKATLSSLDHSLKKLAKHIEANNIESIALPKLATGVGGLKWEDVYNSIKKALDPLNCRVYVYVQYVKGQKAQES